MLLFVLNSEPYRAVNQTFVITDLGEFPTICIIVQKYSVNAVIGFDLINDLIALLLEKCVDCLISTNLKRILQD